MATRKIATKATKTAAVKTSAKDAAVRKTAKKVVVKTSAKKAAKVAGKQTAKKVAGRQTAKKVAGKQTAKKASKVAVKQTAKKAGKQTAKIAKAGVKKAAKTAAVKRTAKQVAKAGVKKAARQRSRLGWSSEGGWAFVMRGARLRERPGAPGADRAADERKAFGAALPGEPLAAVRALGAWADRANAGEVSKRNLDRVMAQAWEQRVCEGLGWSPVELRDSEGRIFRGVVDPERRHFVRGRPYVRRVLELDPGGAGNTLELMYSMLGDGSRLPPAKPGAYLELG